jgi:ubiquinone/menaquinone biosynthesis C-methylase UbiE
MATIPGFFEGTAMPDPGWWEALWPDPAKVLAGVGIEPGMTVIDLCSGDGWFTLPMARIARHVLAVDIDRALLDVARARLGEAGIENVDLIEANAYDIDKLLKERADFVFMANAFHGVPDPKRLAEAVAAVLLPRGKFAVVNWHKRPREETVVLGTPRGPATEQRLSPEETIASVEAGGLRLVRTLEVPPYHYAAIFECSS